MNFPNIMISMIFTVPTFPTFWFTWAAGCSIGALRDYQVEVGSWVRIPTVENSECYKVCTCDDHKKLAACQELQCPGSTDCQIRDQRYPHNSQFMYECNLCVCYSGLVTCTKKHCADEDNAGVVPTIHLPGGCSPYYSPVCGVNGATYLNPCIARYSNLYQCASILLVQNFQQFSTTPSVCTILHFTGKNKKPLLLWYGCSLMMPSISWTFPIILTSTYQMFVAYQHSDYCRQFNMKEKDLPNQSCHSLDLCANSWCGENLVCRPRRQICLDLR